MTQQVLILGGTRRIGSQIAADLLAHTAAQVMIAGRNPEVGVKLSQQLGDLLSAALRYRCRFAPIDLNDWIYLLDSLAQSDLVIHCASPFHHRNAMVLMACIDSGVNYLHVSDHPFFTGKAIALRAKAEAAGITAIVNTGVFPGISNLIVWCGGILSS